jgi:hypothetical protein
MSLLKEEKFKILSHSDSESLFAVFGFYPYFIIGKTNKTSIAGKSNIETASTMMRYIRTGLVRIKVSENINCLEEIYFCVKTPLYAKKIYSEYLKDLIKIWNELCVPLRDFLVVRKTPTKLKVENFDTYDVYLYFIGEAYGDRRNRRFIISEDDALGILEAMATTDPFNNNGLCVSGKML